MEYERLPTPPPIKEPLYDEEEDTGADYSWFYDNDAGGYTMPFGKYAGKKINQISLPYLMWCWNKLKDATTFRAAFAKYYEGLEGLLDKDYEYENFIVPFGRKHYGQTIKECRDKEWFRWTQRKRELVDKHSLYFRAVERWLANPGKHGAKRDVGELLDSSRYEDDLDLKLDLDEYEEDGFVVPDDDSDHDSVLLDDEELAQTTETEPGEIEDEDGEDDEGEEEDTAPITGARRKSGTDSGVASFIVDDEEYAETEKSYHPSDDDEESPPQIMTPRRSSPPRTRSTSTRSNTRKGKRKAQSTDGFVNVQSGASSSKRRSTRLQRRLRRREEIVSPSVSDIGDNVDAYEDVSEAERSPSPLSRRLRSHDKKASRSESPSVLDKLKAARLARSAKKSATKPSSEKRLASPLEESPTPVAGHIRSLKRRRISVEGSDVESNPSPSIKHILGHTQQTAPSSNGPRTSLPLDMPSPGPEEESAPKTESSSSLTLLSDHSRTNRQSAPPPPQTPPPISEPVLHSKTADTSVMPAIKSEEDVNSSIIVPAIKLEEDDHPAKFHTPQRPRRVVPEVYIKTRPMHARKRSFAATEDQTTVQSSSMAPSASGLSTPKRLRLESSNIEFPGNEIVVKANVTSSALSATPRVVVVTERAPESADGDSNDARWIVTLRIS